MALVTKHFPKLDNLGLQGQEMQHIEIIEPSEDGKVLVSAHHLRQPMVVSWFVLGDPISCVTCCWGP